MIALENILNDIVLALPETSVGKPVFYWGTSEDLPQFMQRYGDKAIPLIWLVSGYDKYEDDLAYRDAEIAFCTREDRTDLLNLTRVAENYSYQRVLIPLMESFLKAVDLSEYTWIDGDKKEVLKSPNHSVNGKNEVNNIWDVLKLRTRIYFNESYKC